MQTQNDKLIEALNFHKNGDFQNAEIGYKMVLAGCPHDNIALNYYGRLCIQTNRINEAIELLSKSLKIKPDKESFISLAKLYLDTNNKQEIINLYRNAVESSINIDNPNLLYQIGSIFYKQKLVDESLNCFKLAYLYAPDAFHINRILGFLLLHEKREYEQAHTHYEKALILNQNDSLIQHDLGFLYYVKNDFKNAVKYFEKAAELEPNNSTYLYDLATIYDEILNFEKAIEFYIKAFEADPSNGRAYYQIGCNLLTLGEFDKGWYYFDEARINIFAWHKLRLPENKYPKWNGEDISGKTLYVFGVAGNGDSILFSRYLPILHKNGIKVKCKPQALLYTLLEQSDLKAEFIPEDMPESEIECDYQISMMSLGRIFNANFNNIPFTEGYLKINFEKYEYFKQKYFNNDNYKVGIVWAASGFNKTRSIPLNLFLPIKDIPNVKLYSFQAGGAEKTPDNIPEDFGIINPASEFNNFADAAAAMSNLDLLISADTATIHLAGALGIKSWALIPYLPDWRWSINTDKSYWYNSVKLFRQTSHGNWTEITQKIIENLKIKLV